MGFTSQPSYVAGQLLDVPPAAYQASDRTLLLFTRADCSACRQATPFFRDLVRRLESDSTSRVVLVTGDADRAAEDAYASEIGLPPDRIVFTDWSRLRVRIVPTVVLAGRGGLIAHAWEGVPSVSDRTAILDTLISSRQER